MSQSLSPITSAVLEVSPHVIARANVFAVLVVHAVAIALLITLVVVFCHVSFAAQSVEVVLE